MNLCLLILMTFCPLSSFRLRPNCNRTVLNCHNRIRNSSLLFSPLRPYLLLLPHPFKNFEGRLGFFDGVATQTGRLLLQIFATVAGGKGGSGDIFDGTL